MRLLLLLLLVLVALGGAVPLPRSNAHMNAAKTTRRLLQSDECPRQATDRRRWFVIERKENNNKNLACLPACLLPHTQQNNKQATSSVRTGALALRFLLVTHARSLSLEKFVCNKLTYEAYFRAAAGRAQFPLAPSPLVGRGQAAARI